MGVNNHVCCSARAAVRRKGLRSQELPAAPEKGHAAARKRGARVDKGCVSRYPVHTPWGCAGYTARQRSAGGRRGDAEGTDHRGQTPGKAGHETVLAKYRCINQSG